MKRHTFHLPRSHYPLLIPLLTCRIDTGVYASIYSLKLCFFQLWLAVLLHSAPSAVLPGGLFFFFLSKLPAEHTPGASHSLL